MVLEEKQIAAEELSVEVSVPLYLESLELKGNIKLIASLLPRRLFTVREQLEQLEQVGRLEKGPAESRPWVVEDDLHLEVGGVMEKLCSLPKGLVVEDLSNLAEGAVVEPCSSGEGGVEELCSLVEGAIVEELYTYSLAEGKVGEQLCSLVEGEAGEQLCSLAEGEALEELASRGGQNQLEVIVQCPSSSQLLPEGLAPSSDGGRSRRYIDVGVDNWLCRDCGTRFSSEVAITQHLLVAGRCERAKERKTGELICPRCLSDSFKSRSSWRKHVDYSLECASKKQRKDQKAELQDAELAETEVFRDAGLLPDVLLETDLLSERREEPDPDLGGGELTEEEGVGLSETVFWDHCYTRPSCAGPAPLSSAAPAYTSAASAPPSSAAPAHSRAAPIRPSQVLFVSNLIT